ncbi:hypothetical protein BJY01DRAFT_223717 [Aspergillus pseudoustus]|uniref:Receptor L-domain domain-containing protein n=1 Tax=Aspergillus pseudoustus TaxID=1810923 RepID=A0ABR4J6B4_9EURO
MIGNILSLTVVALVGVLPTGTLARECKANPATRDGYFPTLRLRSEDQLAQFDGCETLYGQLWVEPEFSGTLSLPTVTNFSGSIAADDTPAYGLKAIDLPSVQYMESIYLRGAWGVKTVSAPKLEVIKRLTLTQGVEGSSFDLSALRYMESVSLAGFYESVSFPSLEEIDYGMFFYTDPSRESSDTLVPVDMDFPVLKETGGLFLYGQIKSLSTPQLERLGDPRGWPRGLVVQANYTSMGGVFLPELRELHGLFRLTGYVSAVDTGNLLNTSVALNITSDSPLELHSNLETAGEILLTGGQLAVLDFTNLTTTTNLEISSETPGKCSLSLVEVARYFWRPDEPGFCDDASIAAAGENPYLDPDYTPSILPVAQTPTPTPDYGGWYPTPTPWGSSTPTPTPYYTPTPTPGSGGGKLSREAEAAVATISAVVGCFVIGGWMVLRWRRKHGVKAGSSAAAGGGTAAGGSGSAAAGAARGARVHADHDGDDDDEPLPRHSSDVAPPPYSREEPEKV